MPGKPEDLRSPLDAFLSAFWRDVDDDAVHPLVDYLSGFPGNDDAIAGEYRAFMDAGSASVRAAPPTRAAENRHGPYRLLRQIGRGGQATVYLAEDTRLPRQVALKVLDSGPATDHTAFERFRREAEITSKLDHPGICTVYETGEDRGALWIAMRYVEGDSLAKRISTAKEGQASGNTTSFVILSDHEDPEDAPPDTPATDTRSGPKTWTGITSVLALFEVAARTLHVAHEAGVIHRDIKPGNLIVTKDGDPVILDFGLAQEVQGEQPTLTLIGDIMGTPAYMSPEQIAAQRIRLDRRTDVYSLGVSLYECLTLNRPFNAPTREGLYQAIMTKDPPDVRELNPAIPSDVRVVIGAALEKDRDRRYQTALDFAEDIRRVRRREPILAKPVGRLLRLRRWSQRNPALATALAGLFVVLATGLAVALVLLDQTRRERDAKNAALQRVTVADTQKQAALSDYDRLGDLSRIQRLVAEADRLWPAEPAKVAAMKTWVNRGTDLEKRLASHKEARDRLRMSAGLLPYTDADGAADFKTHAGEQEQLAELRRERATVAGLALTESRVDSKPADSLGPAASGPASGATSRASPDDPRTALANLDADIQRLDAVIHERLTWIFESSADQFKHDTIAKLVTDLTTFVDPDPKKGLLAGVKQRLAFAESVQHETIGQYETKWADTIRSIADRNECPKYNGLKLEPQLGLIPIGKDRESGLWEFAHLQTTEPGTDPIPKRDKDGTLIVTESMGLVFVLVPEGTFRMGATKAQVGQALTDPNIDPLAAANESPVTEIRLNPFLFSKYEMTQGQWLRVVGKNSSGYSSGPLFGRNVVNLRKPVDDVSWEDCDLWLGRLGLRLPTEAQWEYAARGGTTTPWWTGIGTDGLGKAANLADARCRRTGPPTWSYESWDDGYAGPARVGSFAANPFGLHDVLGNVWEWCHDWYAGYAIPPRAGDGLRSPSASRYRVQRGGAFREPASMSRSAVRGLNLPKARFEFLGVRPAGSILQLPR